MTLLFHKNRMHRAWRGGYFCQLSLGGRAAAADASLHYTTMATGRYGWHCTTFGCNKSACTNQCQASFVSPPPPKNRGTTETGRVSN